MTRQQRVIKVSGVVLALGFWVAMLPVCACAQGQLSAQEKEQLIQKLKTAKQQDMAVAADSTADPVSKQDALVQAYKADRRARDLQHGFEVSKAKLADSLWVPPKTLSAAQRAEAIDKLKQAKQLDVRGQEYSAEENSQVSEDKYLTHEQRVDRVLKDLEIGEDVPWSRIQRALEVPENP
ncbi:MAG: hypothetical protein WA005_13910 [Candidatus Binataceae bacterium]